MNREEQLNGTQLATILSFTKTATAVHVTENAIIEMANDAMLRVWGKDSSVIGKSLEDALPELKGQPFIEMFKRVWNEGLTISGTDTAAELEVNGKLQTFYFDFEYRAIKNKAGETYAILHTANDITDRVLGRQAMERSKDQAAALEKEQSLNEALAAANEELNAINEELHEAQENLHQLNNELEERVRQRTKELSDSQARTAYLFSAAPVPIAVLMGRELVVEAANDKILEVWGRTKDVLGKPLAEAIPELQGQLFLELMDDVITTGEPFYATESRAMLNRHNHSEDLYFNVVFHPLKDAEQQTYGLMIVATDVTVQVNARMAIAESESSLRSMVLTAHYALMILRGKDWIIEITNQPLVNLWDKTIAEVTGRPLMEILPEIADQPFPVFLRQVYESGIGYGQEEQVFHYNSPAGPATKYVSFYYDPMFGPDGEVTGIIVAAEDITEQVRNRKLLEQSYEEQQALNEELSATNEELASSYEEIAETQVHLEKSLHDLEESQSRMKYMLDDAPVAIAIFASRDLVIESANSRVLEAWGKTADIIGKPLRLAVPELVGQPFLQIMDDVYTGAKPYYGNEVKAVIEQNDQMEDVYSNFVYQPFKNEQGHTTHIMLMAHMVTEQVMARRKVEQAEELMRFSIEAANVGTWSMSVQDREFIGSPRLKELFGFQRNETVSYDMVTSRIPESYLKSIHDAVDKAIHDGDSYVMEHPILNTEGQERRWVRALGKLYRDESGNPSHFSGLMIDITEQKLEEQRKDDFISIASHELKTPVTSLKASLQLLNRMKESSAFDKMPVLIEQANRSLHKVSTLIDDLLNASKVNAGYLHLNKSRFTISKLINECCNNIRVAGRYAITVTGDMTLEVNADAERVDQVIINFVNNATKYAPDSTEIVLLIERFPAFAKVSVTDQGPGIAPDKQQHLFARYYRADNSGNQYSGLGLGLYISSEIIKKHNGEIGVISEVGKGSTFWFTLPL